MSLSDLLRLPPHRYLGSPSDLAYAPITNGMTSGRSGQAANDAFSLAGTFLPDTTVTKLNQNNKIINSGFTANLFDVGKIGVDPDTYQDGDLFKESILFASHPKPDQTLPHELVHPVKSLQNLNAYLASDEGRRMYGREKTYRHILHTWRLVGALAGGAADWQRNSGNTMHVTLIVAGRTRMPNITKAQKPGYEQHRKLDGNVNEGDYIWPILFKCRCKDALAESLNNSSEQVKKKLGLGETKKRKRDGDDEEEGFAVVRPELPNYCWQFRFVSTTFRQKPGMEMYTSDGDGVDPDSEYVGWCPDRPFAKVSETNADRDGQGDLTAAARHAQAGLPGWQTEITKLTHLVVQQALL